MPEISKYDLDQERKHIEIVECWFWASLIICAMVLVYLAVIGAKQFITGT